MLSIYMGTGGSREASFQTNVTSLTAVWMLRSHCQLWTTRMLVSKKEQGQMLACLHLSLRPTWTDSFAQDLEGFKQSLQPAAEQPGLSLPKAQDSWRRIDLDFDLQQQIVHCCNHPMVASDSHD